jgi:hypothetical protein
MRTQTALAVICGMVLALQSGLASAAGRDACSFLSQNKISAILGLAVDSGRHIGPSTALCRWGEPNDPPIQDIEKTPVSAIGDDAYYIDPPGFGLGLNVKKGNFAFQAKVFGFSAEMTKALENSLAQELLAKL